MNYIKNNNKKNFIGYFWLINRDGKWIIQNDFISFEKTTYRIFFNKYINPIHVSNDIKNNDLKIKDEVIDSNHRSKIKSLRFRFPKINNGNIILVDISKQKLFLYSHENKLVYSYPISSAIKGVGNREGSDKTPLGEQIIKKRFGDNAKLGTIFKSRVNTGIIAEIIKDPVNIEEDDVTTRILWLEGLEVGKNKGGNVDSFLRYIYIHGTPEEGLIGSPASHGCIRMYNKDVINLFNNSSENTLVYIGE